MEEEKKEVSTEEAVEEKKKEKKKSGLLVVLLILLLACGCCYVMFIKPTNKTEKTDVKTKDVKSEYRMSGNSLENFDLAFLKLENEAKNKVYSPLSIKYALEMLAEGADGDTKAQLDAVIGDYEARKYDNNEHMSFANAMFIKNTYSEAVKKEYVENITTKYNAEVIYDPFESPDNINSWVSNKTFNLVNNLLDDVSSNDYFLINALAIDMNWKNQIHCAEGHQIPCIGNGTYHIGYAHEKIADDDNMAYSETDYPYGGIENFPALDFNGVGSVNSAEVLADFNRYDIIKDLGEDKIRSEVTEAYKEWLASEDGKMYVKYTPEAANVESAVNEYIEEIKTNYGKAANSTDFLLYDGEDVKAFAKDLEEYNGTTLQYVGIMPKEKALTDYVNDIKADDINNVISNLKEVKIDSFKEGVATIIRGYIPFFKFEYELKLMEDLKKLGIKDVFDEKKSNLSKLSEGSTINKAIHKANIEFSNDGIKAAAATAMGGYGAASGGFEYLYKIPVEKIDITFDKPYMYIIRDKATGEVWFAGTVYEPIKK